MTGIKRLRARADGYARDGREVDASTLRDIADQIERETLPRPLFEDGEVVQFGDEFVGNDGEVLQVNRLTFFDDGGCMLNSRFAPGRVKRPEPPDTWERIEADVRIGPCAYFDYDGSCEACPTKASHATCATQKVLDIVRRCKALAGVEA